MTFVEEDEDRTEKPGINFAPRLTPEALRERGINVIEFDLV